jgi:hypothetical protein
MVTMHDIDQMFQNGCTTSQIVDAIISIGDESLDFTKPQYGGGFTTLGIGGIHTIPVHKYYPDKEGCYQFHKYDSITEEMKPDPRIIKIGLYIHQIAGLKGMQSIYEAVRPKNQGSMRSLEWAWDNVGEWRA